MCITRHCVNFSNRFKIEVFKRFVQFPFVNHKLLYAVRFCLLLFITYSNGSQKNAVLRILDYGRWFDYVIIVLLEQFFVDLDLSASGIRTNIFYFCLKRFQNQTEINVSQMPKTINELRHHFRLWNILFCFHNIFNFGKFRKTYHRGRFHRKYSYDIIRPNLLFKLLNS